MKFLTILLSSLFISSAYADTVNQDGLVKLIAAIQKNDIDSHKPDMNMVNRLSWKINCWDNVNGNNKICILNKENVSVVRVDDTYNLVIGSNQNKSKNTALNIDNKYKEIAKEGIYRNANALIDNMKTGYTLEISYEDKSLNKEVKKSISLLGFTSALNDLDANFEKVKI